MLHVQSIVSVCLVCSMNVDSVVVWSCELQFIFVVKFDLVYEDLKSCFRLQNMHCDDVRPYRPVQ
jgi:hypothetical protein